MLSPLFSAAMEPQQGEKELQLLLPTATPLNAAYLHAPRAPASPSDHPQLDLSLSISIGPPTPRAADHQTGGTTTADQSKRAAAAAAADVQALKQQAAEQARMASAERAYAERVLELARRELELAEREFARARAIWEHARGEMGKVERVKAMAARRIAAGSAAALEITCHACMQRFHP
ncbi:protein indeterminate-domain 16-like [Miscanthus floridulus]|uniref:protein indeterminate-domain 16-like n=1 Tax=Miscanthus floridulus TaxID=154761 RepID=UPI003459F245